jgi:7-cyano-7-deazaguanine synthase
MTRAVVLLSGGLDSATTLYIAHKEHYQILALTILYGQRHQKEVECARKLAAGMAAEHHILEIAMPWKGSALLDSSAELPTGRNEEEMGKDIPVTYVPARNTIFLSLATSYAEARGAEAIFIGANALDYSGYPDCRPEYFQSFQDMIHRGTKAGVEGKTIEIQTPLLRLTKREIVLLGASLRVPFENTWSCYEGRTKPCGECDSCKLRAKGFEEAGIEDPVALLSLRAPQSGAKQSRNDEGKHDSSPHG